MTPITVPPKESSNTFSLSTLAEPTTSRGGSQTTSVAAPLDSTEVQYRTFLPFNDLTEVGPADRAIVATCIAMHELEHNVVGGGNDTYSPLEATFVGDGRGFSPPQAESGNDSYRTMMDVKYDWEDGTFNNTKDVGTTVIIDTDTGDPLENRVASEAGMKFQNPQTASNYASVVLYHIANDPFCPSLYELGAISYRVNIEMYRSGLVRVTGWRFTMPSHEVWVRWNGEPQWTNLFEGKATSLVCLAIGYGTREANLPQICHRTFTGNLTRTTDRWLSFDGSWGATASGKLWGSGETSLLAPHGNGLSNCYVNGRLVQAPSLPLGVTAAQIRVSDVFSFTTFTTKHWITVLGSNGRIYTWGNATDAQLGRSATILNRNFPTAVDSQTYVGFSNDGSTTYAVTTGGDVYTWGGRIFDYNVQNEPAPYTTPTLQYGGADIVQVEVAGNSALGLDSGGSIHQFGLDVYDPVAETSFDSWHELTVAGVTFTDIAVVDGFRIGDYALDDEGQLFYWNGSNVATSSYDPNSPGYEQIPSPELVETDFEFQSIVGGDQGAGLSDDGSTVLTWHDFRAPPTYIDSYAYAVPAPPTPLSALVRDASGSPYGIGIDAQGEAWQLKYNQDDELEWQFYGRPPSRDEKDGATCY